MKKYDSIEELVKDFKQKVKLYAHRHNGFRIMYVFEYGSKNKRLHAHFIGDIPEECIRINKNNRPELSYFTDRFGFTQLSEIKQTTEDYNKVSGYISKYITKDCLKVGNRYFHKVGKFEKPEAVSVSPSDVVNVLPELYKIKRTTKNGAVSVIW